MNAVPARVCFNFAAKCNMRCPYCYIPFDGREAGVEVWKAVVDRVASWGSRAMTFGGGDPFLYGPFRELLVHAKNHGFFIQVDTNALLMKDDDYDLTAKHVDLLGLPLDGSTPELHGAMRRHKKHFHTIVAALQNSRARNIPIKINTVVSSLNVGDLLNIAELLRLHKIERWALYEFWPLGQIALDNALQYNISKESFLRETDKLREIVDFATLEIGSISVRHNSYFFVTHTGKAYTVNPNNHSEYVDLGSIFDEQVLKIWNEYANPALNTARLEPRIRTST